MFIKIGDIAGESRDHTHRGEIDVLAWSWGMTSGPQAEFQDLALTKFVDKASPKLLEACSGGRHIPVATLTVRKAGSQPLEYIVIEMQDVRVSSVATGSEGGEDRLTENVTLSFGQVKVTYTEQDADGKPVGKVEYSWNIEENRSGSRPISKSPNRRRP
jgi:type VI secretion system secreted protein Hcp